MHCLVLMCIEILIEALNNSGVFYSHVVSVNAYSIYLEAPQIVE